jgi:alpha/beta superfamily hydrolase
MTHAETVTLAGPFVLEGILTRGTGSQGIIITHPHPLYGGDMNNPVVKTVARTFAAADCATLRFNFRGTGSSQGKFAEGEGEIDDLLAAREYLLEAGIKDITFAGYSFGAWVIVNAAAAGKLDNEPLILISPPAAMLPFAKSLKLPHLKQVITGELDQIAPPAPVKELIASWNPAASLAVIPDCDHFFHGFQPDLAAILKKLTHK